MVKTKIPQILLMVLLLSSAACQENGVDLTPTNIEENEVEAPVTAAPESEPTLPPAAVVTVAAENEGDEVGTDASIEVVASEAVPEIVPTPDNRVAKSVEDVVNVSVSLVNGTNEAPTAKADVFIFSGELMVAQGTADKGIYRQDLPEGTYSIAAVYKSSPPAGFLRKDISFTGNESAVVDFVVPTESELSVQVVTDNGLPPAQDFQINIMADGEEIIKKNMKVKDQGTAVFLLREDMTYQVIINYPNHEIVLSDVTLGLDSGQAAIVERLPFSENVLDVFLRDGGEPLLNVATVSIFTEDGTLVAENVEIMDLYSVALPADQTYIVRVAYPGYLSIERSVTLPLLGLTQELIEFSAPAPTPDSQPTPELTPEPTPESG